MRNVLMYSQLYRKKHYDSNGRARKHVLCDSSCVINGLFYNSHMLDEKKSLGQRQLHRRHERRQWGM